jgi:hypothetical protein
VLLSVVVVASAVTNKYCTVHSLETLESLDSGDAGGSIITSMSMMSIHPVVVLVLSIEIFLLSAT